MSESTVTKLNKTALREWVSALRSGTYTQTTGVLADTRGYCCLGVACDIFAERLKIDISRTTENDIIIFDDRRCALPVKVIEFLGVPLDFHRLINDEIELVNFTEAAQIEGSPLLATSLNDSYRLTLAQIADVIWWEFNLGEDDE